MLAAVQQAKLEDKEIKKELRKALQPVKRRMRQLIPPPGYPGDKPGYASLRSTTQIRIRDLRPQVWFGIVGPTYSNTPRVGGNHAHLVEDGTAPHEIPTPRENPTRVIDHPGADAVHFVRDTWNGMSAQVLDNIAKIAGQKFVDNIKALVNKTQVQTQSAAAQSDVLAALRRAA